MVKRFFLGLLKFIVTLAVCVAVGSAAVYYIYNEYAIDPQVLIDEYEQIAQEKEIVLPTPTPAVSDDANDDVADDGEVADDVDADDTTEGDTTEDDSNAVIDAQDA